MSASHIIEELEKLVSGLKDKYRPEVKEVENDVKAIGQAAVSYIEHAGLKDLYNIATAALLGVATGTPWATVAATVVEQGTAAGIAIAKGAETIVLAQAQADLLAAGKIAAPTTGEVITPITPA